MKILFVDDEKLILDLYKYEMETSFPEIEVFFEMNGKDALELCRSHNFDIIFTDGKMPILDGIQFATELRSLKYKTNIILITGHHSLISDIDDDIFNAIWQKPVDLDHVLSYINSYL